MALCALGGVASLLDEWTLVVKLAGLGKRIRRRGQDAPRRFFVILLFSALLIAGVVFDGHPVLQQSARVIQPPGAAEEGVSSSAWYCALTPARSGDTGAGIIVLANLGNSKVTGTITVSPPEGKSVDVPVDLAGRSRMELQLGTVVDALYAGAMVRLNGGGVAVEHGVRLAEGLDLSPCSTTGSAKWHFADGSTMVGMGLTIGVFNPYREEAIVDFSFSTDIGQADPPALQGITIAPQSLYVLPVTEHVHRREWISSSVTARSGRVVADQLFSGRIGSTPGVGLFAGSVRPKSTWYVPDVTLAAGQRTSVSFYNPSETTEAVVQASMIAENAVDPFILHVPTQTRVVLVFPNERVALPARFGLVVETLPGSPDVVVLQANVSEAPSSLVQWSGLTALQDVGTHWAFPFGTTLGETRESIRIMNPGTEPAKVTVKGFTATGQVLTESTVEVQAKGLGIVDVNTLAPNTSPVIELESDQPIAAVRRIYAPMPVGESVGAGVLLRR